MSLLSEHLSLSELDQWLSEVPAMSRDVMTAVRRAVGTRSASLRHTEQAARAERLMRSGAWIDAVLALLALEAPQWQIRRIVYDQGEWHCAVSRERELPDWLDQSTEARHADLAIAVLRAWVSARLSTTLSTRSSVPSVPHLAAETYQPMCCDNFA